MALNDLDALEYQQMLAREKVVVDNVKQMFESAKPQEESKQADLTPHELNLIENIDYTPIQRQKDLPYPDHGIARTPLVRAVTHLLKIGSTHKQELEQMAAEFITEEDACKKLGMDYNNFRIDHFRASLFSNLKSVITVDDWQRFEISLSPDFHSIAQNNTMIYSNLDIKEKLLDGFRFHVTENQKEDFLFTGVKNEHNNNTI